MLNSTFKTVVVAFAFVACCSGQSWKYISIDPENGQNAPVCTSGNVSIPCKNLTYAFAQYQSWTQFVLYPGNHYIYSGSVLFQNTILLSISPLQAVQTNVFCMNSSGLSFFNVTGVSIAGLRFVGCSASQVSTNQNYSSAAFSLSTQLVGIFFNQCKDVNMTGVTVSDGVGATGVILYNTIGNVVISGSSFLRNNIDGIGAGGGGLVVEFSYCIPGDNLCLQHPFSVSTNHDSTYTLYNCTFTQNAAVWASPNPALPYQSAHSTFGKGGGLSVSFNGNASNNTMQIVECSFENNTAIVGAGVFAHFGDNATKNKLTLKNSLFVNNKSPLIQSATSGGGLRIEHNMYDSATNGGTNAVDLSNCQFFGNSALSGGGLSASLSGTLDAAISNCTFVSNKAQNGAAIEASVFGSVISGLLKIANCSFSGNSVKYSSSAASPVGTGTVYINGVPVSFTNLLSFDHNIGAAIALTGTQGNFSHCNALFRSNEALNGGGLSLLGAASMIVDDQTIMQFYDNYASNFGGAIYNLYLGINLNTYSNCFVQYTSRLVDPVDWNATFSFANNTSGQRGSSIYSTSLIPCAAMSRVSALNVSATFCWNSKWIYQSSSCTDEIASDISSIVLPQSGVSAIPGQAFQLPLLFQDDLNHTVPSASLLTATTANSSASMVDPQYTRLSSNYLIVTGQEESSNVMELTVAGEQAWYLTFPIHLNRCPPGMKLDSSSSPKCICPALDAYQSSLYCDAQNFQTYLRNGFWLGLDAPTNKLVVALCPPNFCYVNESGWAFKLPQNISELESIICGPKNRYGVVCGNCIEGYGPAVNSLRYECVPCSRSTFSVNLTKYIFTVYVPLLVFFLVIFLFNVHLTTGPANGFILYSQVVISTFALHGDYHIPLYTITPYSDRLLKAYQVSYGIFNLETFSSILHPFCLSQSMNTLNVLQLSYLVAIFPLLMVLTIILIIKLRAYKCCRCCGNSSNRVVQAIYGKIRFSPLHAFAAFLLLSYNRLCLTSTYMVNVQPLKDEYGSVVGAPRPYYVQTIDGTSEQYILEYKLIGAFILLTIVLIPPFLLLGYPVRWFENYIVAKVSFLQRFYPVDKVTILLDVFQGCYRDKRRFFASFYFFFRLAVNVAYFMTDTWIDQYNIQVVLCAVMVLSIAVLQPYKRKVLNYVDIAIFIDMLILSLLSIYLYEKGDYDPYSPLPLFPYVVQYILIFLPLLGMISYVVWLFLKYIRNAILGRHESADIRSFDANQSVDLDNVVANVEFQSSFALEDDILNRAGAGNSYVPFAVVEQSNNQKDAETRSRLNSTASRHLSERAPLN